MNDTSARHWLEKIHRLPQPDNVFNVLNVCGGHERSISQAGLRTILPPWLNLIPGPGCPVCVCPEVDIALAIAIAHDENVILVAFGDMLRVPVSSGKSRPQQSLKMAKSMLEAKAMGANIRPIASPMDARQLALRYPDKLVVFFAAGFETTMAPVAALISEYFSGQLPENLRFLISGRRTWPAVEALLNDRHSAPIHGMIAPGHVATVMGAIEWQPAITQYHLPTAIAGFTSESLLQAFYSVLLQAHTPTRSLANCYPQVVTNTGNGTAQAIIKKCFSIVDANWRGIGTIPSSGYQLVASLSSIDARHQFSAHVSRVSKAYAHNHMPKSCRCADVIMARHLPNQCPLYGKGCTPQNPLGPCMVSDEGACRIWWNAGAEQAV